MRLRKFGLLVAAALSLSGCIVVPYKAPEGTVGARAEVAATVPADVVPGKTRDQVLQAEGKPDGEGEGANWFVYSSTAKESGLGLFFCAVGNYNMGCGDARRQVWDYRRLVVRFDAAGLVSDARVDSASCLRWTGDFKAPVPCLDLRGDDLRRADAVAAAEKGKQVIATFQDVRWPADEDNDCVYYGKLILAQGSLLFVASADSPYDRNRVQVDPTRCPEPESVVSFDDAEIADLSLVKGMADDRSVKLSRKDGSHFTWQFISDDGKGFHFSALVPGHNADYSKVDDDLTREDAAELTTDIQKVTGKAPDAFGGLDDPSQGGPRTFDRVRWCSGWEPPTVALVQSQLPCAKPKDGYLILTDSGLLFQLADSGDGVNGLVSAMYEDIRSADIRESGLLGSYSHWVVVETKDGEVDAFDPDDSDSREAINVIISSHLAQQGHP